MRQMYRHKVLEALSNYGYDILRNAEGKAIAAQKGTLRIELVDEKHIDKINFEVTVVFKEVLANKRYEELGKIRTMVLIAINGFNDAAEEIANYASRRFTFEAIDEQLERIAKKYFGVQTLETRHSDRLDFYDVSVWSMRDALHEAYQLGLYGNKKKGQK